MFNPVLAKAVVNLVVTHCSGRVISQVVRANVIPVTNLQKVQVTIGTFALAGAAGAAASNALMDDIEAFEGFVQGIKEAKQEQA